MGKRGLHLSFELYTKKEGARERKRKTGKRRTKKEKEERREKKLEQKSIGTPAFPPSPGDLT